MSKIKQMLIGIKWFPTHIINLLVMKCRGISYGNGLTTLGTIFIRGTGKITLGEQVRIISCREANPIGGDIKTILFAKGKSEIIIGNHTGLSNSAIVALNRIEIGDYVFIGSNCKIYDHDFHSIQFEKRIMKNDPGVKSAPILIKNGAFIGAHCIILKGVTIGEKSVVGAGSVVTQNIPDGEIWAGNPVKFIRKV